MCLIDKKRFRFTIFPKIVYKKFLYSRGEKKLRNYCQLTEVTSRVLIPNSYDEPEYNIVFEGYLFGRGFIHALKNPGSRVKMQFKSYGDIEYIFKCMIPPFTRYAIDTIDGEICARKMIIIDKLAKHVFDR